MKIPLIILHHAGEHVGDILLLTFTNVNTTGNMMSAKRIKVMSIDGMISTSFVLQVDNVSIVIDLQFNYDKYIKDVVTHAQNERLPPVQLHSVYETKKHLRGTSASSLHIESNFIALETKTKLVSAVGILPLNSLQSRIVIKDRRENT